MKVKTTKKIAEIDIHELIAQYRGTSEQIKILNERKEDLATQIKDRAERDGAKDQNGNYYGTCGDYVYGKQARKKITVNFDKAKEFLASKKLWGYVCDTKEIINEDNLAKLVEKNKISTSDFEELCDVKVTYAIDVHEKEKEEEEVEDTTDTVIKEVNMVDRKKTMFKRRR